MIQEGGAQSDVRRSLLRLIVVTLEDRHMALAKFLEGPLKVARRRVKGTASIRTISPEARQIP